MVKHIRAKFDPDDPIFREGPSIFSAPPRGQTIGEGAPRLLRGGSRVIFGAFGAQRPQKPQDPVKAAPMSDADMAQQYELQRRLEESLRRKDDER